MKKPHRIAAEVAEASRALANDLPVRHVKPTHANVLIDTAKRLQRLQSRAAKLRKALATTTRDIRHAKKELKALAQAIGRGE
jgi:F0F1-type ATP synthase epsilon subunit